VFWESRGPQYRDLYPEPPPPGMVPSCAEGGVLGVLCASIGSIMGTEAVKLITGIGEPLLGRLMIYDALEMSYRTVRIRKHPQTVKITGLIDYDYFCGTITPEAAEAAKDSTISVKELALMLEQRERGEREFLLVDVREPNEWDIVSIPGAVLVPKGEFLSGEALQDLPQDKQVVFHCKVGGRSAEVLALAKAAGFSDAVHVGGGVVAWVNQIEPDKPNY
jgi:adenylyltransferase/sulfurtransferase